MSRSRPTWWSTVKIASDAWKENARTEGISEEIIEWADRVGRGRGGMLWFARLASKNPPELHPGQDDGQIDQILTDWVTYGSATGVSALEDFNSKTAYSEAIGIAKQKVEGVDAGSWNRNRQKTAPDLRPLSIFSSASGRDVFASYILDTKSGLDTLNGISSYCVRGEAGVRYQPHRYFLVTHNGSIFALIHPESNQCKDARDAELRGCDAAIAVISAFKPMSESGLEAWALQKIASSSSTCSGSSIGLLIEMVSRFPKGMRETVIIGLASDKTGSFAMSIILSHERGTLPKDEFYESLYRESLKMARSGEMDMLSVIKDSVADIDGMFRKILWMYDDGRRRKDEEYLDRLRGILEKSVSFRRADIMQVDLKTMRKMASAMQSLGASNRAAEIGQIQHAYAASQAHASKTRLQADHDEKPLLAEGDPATIMWYYTHVARGRTLPNQQPNSGKPWPALEGKIIEVLQSAPPAAANMLRQYLNLVEGPMERLSGMMEAATKAGLGERFASVIPSDFRNPS